MSHHASDRQTASNIRFSLVLTAAVCGLIATGCETTGGKLGESVTGATSWVKGMGQDLVSKVSPGTASSEAEKDLTADEKRLREQSKAFQKTVWEGALVGAGAGALWGVIRGDNGSEILKKAAIGGAVGGLAGVYVAQKQKQYSSKEDQLESMTSDVRQSNAETKDLIASVKAVIKEDKRRLADVTKRLKKGQATASEVETVRKRITDNQTVVAQASKGAHEKAGMFDGAAQTYRTQNPSTDTAGLQKEIKTFNKQIETLDGLAKSISVA